MSERKILVVDDEAEVRSVFQRTFERAGYSVRAAASAEEALQILKGESIQVMFLDLVMPGMDGAELCIEIRKTSHFAVIYGVTGYASLLDAGATGQQGFDHHYIKPVKLETLLGAAEAAFEKVDAWQIHGDSLSVVPG